MESNGSTNGWNVGFWGKMNEEMLAARYPVHRACRDGDHNALSSMLSHGKQDLYIEDQFYGWTPAHWAAYYGKLECLQMLISCGVNGEVATQRFHQSPAHVAAFGSQPHCLMWLVQNGANVNAQDYLGETPSHKAARSGSLECLGILKANGAQFTIKNNNGHLPKDLAISCGNETSARYIMQVEQSSGLNGHNVHTNGLCSRKRGITEINGEEIKKIRADPSMPLAQPLPVETVEQSMVPDGLPVAEPCPQLLEVYAEPMDSVIENDSNQRLGLLPVPEATPGNSQVCRKDVVASSRKKNESWKCQAFVI
ncbi:ankyrin repeat domain-containing protein 10-like isoform X3 [Amphiura filiformis]|uniref:ankyrin repeat domain-containing protein 10-like isoform X3 n=1 Tax=Amphiura filiformis TaxID=82378 RepID=UPI003B21A6FD